MKQICLLAIFLALPALGYTYETDRAITNYSHELAVCATFYSLSAEGVRRTGEDELAKQLYSSADIAMRMSAKLSNRDVLEARMKMSMDEQLKLMKHDYSNMSILLAKYKDLCKFAVENPDKRLQYWLNME